MIFSKIRTFWGLGRQGRRLARESLLLPLFVHCGFVLVGVLRTRSILACWARRKPEPWPGAGEERVPEAVRVQRIVRNATGVGGACLVRSLVLQAILERRGLVTHLRVGVRKMADRMEGHAWLEYQGRPINESPEVAGTYVLFEGAAQLDEWRSLK